MASFAPRSLLTFQDSHPLVLDLFLIKNLGPEYYAWEAETVWHEAIKAANAPNISEVNKNKIEAIRTIHLTDGSFKRWEVFEKVIAALNGIVPRFDVMQKPDLGQLLNGVDIMLKLRSHHFSEEVAKYVAAALLTDGVAFAPKPLTFANEHMKDMHPLHAKVAAMLESNSTPDDEALSVQREKINEALLYKRDVARRLIEQMRVVSGSNHSPQL